MLKLTTAAGVFGPYTTVETREDRYRCDGADLPFTVVGAGTVEYWTEPMPTPAPYIPPVPQEVTSFQAKAALLQAGLLPAVTAYMATAPAFDQLAWAESTTFQRESPTLNRAAAALGMTSAQLDQLFIAASVIQA